MTERKSDCCGPAVRNGSFDLAVIGAGSAGFSAAIRAAELGAQVALIGHGTIGGTCVNVGCVPSKTLIRATETLHQAARASRFAGIEGQAAIRDWGAVIAQKDDLVAELRQAKYADLLPAYNNIAYLDGPARLAGDGVAVNGNKVQAEKIVVATGARPAIPDIPGIEDIPYLTSTTALELDKLPESLLVIGGGYIGAEIAQMLARTGVTVTIVCRSRLLPAAEPEIGDALTGYFRDEGIRLESGVHYEDIARTDKGVTLRICREGQKDRLEAEQVLVATGRQPNTEGLGLDETGVRRNDRGGIIVDDRMRTCKSGVYAAGDVTGRHQFVYTVQRMK